MSRVHENHHGTWSSDEQRSKSWGGVGTVGGHALLFAYLELKFILCSNPAICSRYIIDIIYGSCMQKDTHNGGCFATSIFKLDI